MTALALAGFVAAPPVRSQGWGEPLKIRVGADSNACGILLPKSRKPRPIVLWLHGGMRSQNAEKGWTAEQALIPFLKPGSYYLCSPSAHAGEDWLSPKGLEHIEGLLDYMARTYPARMDKLILVGVSDGCLGALRYAREGRRKAARHVLFSAYPPLAVDPQALLDEPVYTTSRWEIFQGGKDRLFPADRVFPLLREWARANPRVKLHLYPEGEHDFSWYAEHAAPEIRRLF